MAITVIVEDGSIVADANSYISVSDARTFATNRGKTLPTNDDAVAAYLIAASDYIDLLEPNFKGSRVSASQELAFPRTEVVIDGIYVNGILVASTAIPKQLIKAQMSLVLAQNDGLELNPNTSREDYEESVTVGPISVDYATATDISATPVLKEASALLQTMYKNSNATGSFNIVKAF